MLKNFIPSNEASPGSRLWWRYLTASKMAQAACLNTYGGGPHSIWFDSVLGIGKDISNEPAIQHGVMYEPHIRTLTAQLFGVFSAETYGMFLMNEEVPFVALGDFAWQENWKKLAATPDGLVADGDSILEIKAPYSKHTTDFDIPLPHYVQIQMTMFVTGRQFAYYAILVLDGADEIIRLRRYRFNDLFVNNVLGWADNMLTAWGDASKGNIVPTRCNKRKERMELSKSIIHDPIYDSGAIVVPIPLTYGEQNV